MRVVTPAENHQNRKPHKNGTTGQRGVIWCKQANKWKAVVRVKGQKSFERFFAKKDDAILAVKKARKVYMPFSVDDIDFESYTEEDLLKEYPVYHHDKKNTGRKSKSGYMGVYWHKRSRKWLSYHIYNNGKKYLGSFKNKQDAIEAVKKVQKAI